MIKNVHFYHQNFKDSIITLKNKCLYLVVLNLPFFSQMMGFLKVLADNNRYRVFFFLKVSHMPGIMLNIFHTLSHLVPWK